MLAYRKQLFSCVSSTNAVVREALDAGEPEGLVVRARMQTGGRGRQGHVWESPAGGMYVSLLLRPRTSPEMLPTLGLVAALGLRRALGSLLPDDQLARISVKWPNDLLLDGATGAKLAGILCEAHAQGVALGVGLNVFPQVEAGATAVSADSAEGKADESHRWPAGSAADFAPLCSAYAARKAYLQELGYAGICDERGMVDQAAEAFLSAFASVYDRWLREGFAPFVREYAACDALRGKRVNMVNHGGNTFVEGLSRGVDEQGRLIISTDDGKSQPVFSGEARIAQIK